MMPISQVLPRASGGVSIPTYIGGKTVAASGGSTELDKFDTAALTCAPNTQALKTATTLAGPVWSAQAGYWMCGLNGGTLNIVQKILYSTEATSNVGVSAGATQTRTSFFGPSYGRVFRITANFHIDYVKFSDDTRGNEYSGIAYPGFVARNNGRGPCSATFGYIFGGDWVGLFKNNVDNYQYSTTTFSAMANFLTTLEACQPVNNRPAGKGYLLGYVQTNDPTAINDVIEVDFATHTYFSLVTALVDGQGEGAGVYNTTHGFACGGSPAVPYPPQDTDRIQRFDFATKTTAMLGVVLTSQKEGQGGVSTTV